MQDVNAPIDIFHRISLVLIEDIRKKLIELREPGWEPAPMDPEWEPSHRDCLHPRPYSGGYRSLLGEPAPPLHRGDEVFFYDYALGRGRHPCILERTDRTGVMRR
jgi:hypothetical protein